MFRNNLPTLHLLYALGLGMIMTGCGQDMADQPHVEPLESSDFFSDGQSARPLVPGTVARGHLRTDKAYYEGKLDGKPVEAFPQETVAEQLGLEGNDKQVLSGILNRGQERFHIFCAPCHGQTGNGEGMVVKRGFPAAPSYHIDRLRDVPIGHFYDVTTMGFGRMPDYADQIPPADRWAIAAYVRALQLSQHAQTNQLTEADQNALAEDSGGDSP